MVKNKLINWIHTPRAINNGIINSLAGLITSLTGLLGSILIVKTLSLEDYGQFSYFLWLAGFLSTLSTFNIPIAITKVTSELRGAGKSREVKQLTLWITIILLIINVVITAGLILLGIFSTQASKIVYWLISLIMIPNSMASISRSFLWGKQKYLFVSLTNISASVLSLFLIVIGYYFVVNVYWFAFSNIAINIIQFILLGIYLIKPSLKNLFQHLGNLKVHRSTKRLFWGFAFPSLLEMVVTLIIYQRSEVFFIEKFNHISEVGYFSISFTIFSILLGVGWALINGYFPAVSHEFGAKAWKNIQKQIDQGTLFGFFYAIPVIFGGLVFIEAFIRFIYGYKMLPSIPILRILLLGVFPGMIVGITGLSLSAIGGIWDRVKVGLLVAMVHLTLCQLIIPKYGTQGAALVNLLSQSINASLLLFILKKKYGINLPFQRIVKMLLIGFLVTGILPYFLLQFISPGFGLLVSIVLIGIIYFFAMKLFGFTKIFSDD
jgi:O-antigen/teichoic acid export membrane protein